MLALALVVTMCVTDRTEDGRATLECGDAMTTVHAPHLREGDVVAVPGFAVDTLATRKRLEAATAQREKLTRHR